MPFSPKHTLGGKPSDLTDDLEAIAHLVAETEEIIRRSVAPHQVPAVMKERNRFVQTLANAYSWKHARKKSV